MDTERPQIQLQAWFLLAGCLLASALHGGCAAVPPAPAAAAAAAPTSAQAGATTLVAIAPPATPPPTLPQFLGISGALKGTAAGVRKIGSRIRNRLGSRFPELEAKPPLTSITDPANSGPDADPSSQKAAEFKGEEDKAPQKIKSIRYLAKLGCGGCYPGVDEAILSALEDCTESVRYEAVKAIRGRAGGPCQSCNADGCCSPILVKKLAELANQRDDKGCYREPSARIRRLARLALAGCGGPVPAGQDDAFPEEGPPAEEPEVISGTPTPAESATATTAARIPSDDAGSDSPAIEVVNLEDDMVLARVNGEPIFESEILAAVRERGNSITESQLLDALRNAIERKLICQEALRNLTSGELLTIAMRQDNDYNAQGSSLRSVKTEDAIADYWRQRIVPRNAPISPDEIERAYRADFGSERLPPEVRWEQVTVMKSRFAVPDQAVAIANYLRMRALGHEVPTPLEFRREDVDSQVIDFRPMNKIPDPRLARFLSAMPVGETSQLCEDPTKIMFYRVLDRRPERPVPLELVADTIRQRIETARNERWLDGHTDDLWHTSKIWTVFDMSRVRSGDTAANVANPTKREVGGVNTTSHVTETNEASRRQAGGSPQQVSTASTE